MTPNVADILIEALPYIRFFSGMTIVIKYGGHAMVDEQLKIDFARDITLMKYVGMNPVVVHGGGMDVVEMVLGGKVNKGIVAQINQQGGKSVGLCGKDGGLICAEKLTIMDPGDENRPPEIIDPGLVGKVTQVNPSIINTLTNQGFIPVIAPVGVGVNGETYNINADLVAGKVAGALSAGRLIYLTDVDGILDGSGNLISSMNTESIHKMVEDHTISGGMIPKIEYAMDALKSGVGKVQIINGTRRHALLLELFTDKGIGTEVVE
ncbi:MAG: acetylglutamate kinase [Desulfobacterales bacterium]|nr:acetylglutamate kinase [Desulfobacterales bacterium]